MKIKKLLCLLLTLSMLLPTLLMCVVLEISADDITAVPNSYVKEGLVALYSGTQNTRAGHDTASTVWEDLVGGHDITITTNTKNYFTENGLKLSAAQNDFPKAIVDTVNGDAFTVEINMADLVSTADAYSTIMNSTNDAFALFRRIDGDLLEFKFANNTAPDRNKVEGCLKLLQDAVITVTYEVGGESIIYINGEKMSSMPATVAMGAGDLFFGHTEEHRHFDTLYRSIRFYNRALNEAEIRHNLAVDGKLAVTDLYVTEGLVSLYSGISNTEKGYDPAATAWADLVGNNDLPLTASQNSYFNDAGLYVKGVQHYFPQAIVDLVNGKAFTVELNFDEFISIGGSFNTFLNSENDNFALFRRNSNDVLEFKFSGNTGSERPIVADGLELINNGTVTVTYEVGGKCCIYVDGVYQTEVTVPKAMGANNLFIGHAEPSKQFETIYRSIRFYNRVLTAEEIAKNAAADGTYTSSTGIPGVVVSTHITVAQPRTNIVGDVAMIREISSTAELTAMLAEKNPPAAAIYTVNEKMQVMDQGGKAMANFSEVMEATQYKILPILVPTNAAAVDAITAYTKETKFTDICILSSDAALVNTARTKMPTVRGAIDFTEALKETTELTQEQCLDIRRTVRANAASVAVLPAHVAKQDMVQYLYDVQVNVWVRTGDDLDEAAAYNALLSGAVGVISDDTKTLLDLACALPENTVTRVPLNVGHRGIPSAAPENTVEGSLYAYEMGADCIELDVYLTTDGEVVVMHDGNTGRTCNKDLPVEGSTWAQLSELYVNKGYENNEKYKNCRIPRLKDYLEAFKDKECRLFIEIKSGKTQIVKKIKELVEQYDMYGQCSVITFNTGIMGAMRKDYPEMSVGALCSGYMDESDSDADMKAVMGFIGKYNATLNPSYAGYGKNAIRAALIRGIGVFPWTFRGDSNTYKNHFLWGYSGLTGDNADVLRRFVKDYEVVVNGDATIIGSSVTLDMLMTYYNRKTNNANNVTVAALNGKELVTIDNNKVTFKGAGEVTLLVSTTYTVSNTKVALYAQPVTLTVTDPNAVETQPEDTSAPDEPVVTDPVDTTDSTDNTDNTSSVGGADTSDVTVIPDPEPAIDKGCASVMGGASIAILTVVTLIGGAWKLRKKD